MLSFSPDEYPQVELLDHMVVVFLNFWGAVMYVDRVCSYIVVIAIVVLASTSSHHVIIIYLGGIIKI